MSAKEQRRQKKLAKKRSKDLVKKREAAREKNLMKSFAGQMQAASHGAIERCLLSESLLDPDEKFGSILISRKLPDGRLAFARYLVDGKCLGVKDADASICFPADLSHLIEQVSRSETLQEALPSAAFKLLISAVAYARDFGFAPHSLYERTLPLWEGVAPDECLTEFDFGEGGKPHFISGPHDSAEQIAHCVTKLEDAVGEGDYLFTIAQGGGLEDGLSDDLYEHSDDFSPMIDDRELDVDIDEDVPTIET